MEHIKLGAKYKAFLRHKARVEFLEGTTYAGKTTVGVIKFMLQVAASRKRQHIIAGNDLGTVEKNIINKELGVLDVFGGLATYYASGRGGENIPHIKFQDKSIYVLGYSDKARWKKALGSQSGCVYIDEINIADMDFVREIAMRCDYLMATLNPDDPDLPVYKEYINHSRPLPEWEHETPEELLAMLNEPAKPAWAHWYFSFEHNPSLTQDKRREIIESVPTGTKLYKNKILGVRGRATGLVFDLKPEQIITAKQAHELTFQTYTLGVDTAYSRTSEDTIAFIFGGLTTDNRWVVLAEKVHNNAGGGRVWTPSDTPAEIEKFMERQREIWGFGRHVFIDSADQGTLLEAHKHKQSHGSLLQYQGAWKKTKVIDRLNLQTGWMSRGDYLIVEDCHEAIRELNTYAWNENEDAPEDRNDHTINAAQYGWLPHKDKIGKR